MGSSTNRNLAAKHVKAKGQKVAFVQNEITKAYNYTPVSDADRLTAALAGLPGTVAVQGHDVRRIGMVTRSKVSTVKVGDDSITREKSVTKSQGMRAYLRSMF